MFFEHISKQFTEILKKQGSRKTKAMSDLEPPKNVEYLFQRFLFILKPTAFYQEIILIKKIN